MKGKIQYKINLTKVKAKGTFEIFLSVVYFSFPFNKINRVNRQLKYLI